MTPKYGNLNANLNNIYRAFIKKKKPNNLKMWKILNQVVQDE